MKFLMYLLVTILFIGFVGFIVIGLSPVEVQQTPVIKDVSDKIE